MQLFKSLDGMLINNHTACKRDYPTLYIGLPAALITKLNALSPAQEPSELGETTSWKYVRSAVTGGLGIALMLELQHPVLPACKQMWRSLNYTVDLMT